jgi:hypothetical protein
VRRQDQAQGHCPGQTTPHPDAKQTAPAGARCHSVRRRGKVVVPATHVWAAPPVRYCRCLTPTTDRARRTVRKAQPIRVVGYRPARVLFGRNRQRSARTTPWLNLAVGARRAPHCGGEEALRIPAACRERTPRSARAGRGAHAKRDDFRALAIAVKPPTMPA